MTIRTTPPPGGEVKCRPDIYGSIRYVDEQKTMVISPNWRSFWRSFLANDAKLKVLFGKRSSFPKIEGPFWHRIVLARPLLERLRSILDFGFWILVERLRSIFDFDFGFWFWPLFDMLTCRFFYLKKDAETIKSTVSRIVVSAATHQVKNSTTQQVEKRITFTVITHVSPYVHMWRRPYADVCKHVNCGAKQVRAGLSLVDTFSGPETSEHRNFWVNLCGKFHWVNLMSSWPDLLQWNLLHKLTQKFRCSEVSGPKKVSTNERPALLHKLTQKFRCSEVSGPENVSTNERPALTLALFQIWAFHRKRGGHGNKLITPVSKVDNPKAIWLRGL